MTQPVATQSYTQATGNASSAVFITFLSDRAPTVNDIAYPVSKRWVNVNTAKEYILMGFNVVAGISQAIWLNLTNGISGGIDELTPDNSVVVNPVSGNVNVLGDTYTIATKGNGSNTLNMGVLLPSPNYSTMYVNGQAIGGVTPGASGTVLTSNGSGTAPTYQASSASLTMAAFGNTPNADGGTIATGSLTLQPCDASNPGGISTTGTQVIPGIKSFADAPIVPLTGVLIGNGSSAVSGNPITQYDVLIGGSLNTINSVGPGSTAGVPLISNGTGAPSFGTALVAGGGTGNTNFPINGVVYSGGTTTSYLSARTLTDGQIVIGATSGAPNASSITAGAGITVTPGPNTITISSSATGFVWGVLTGNTVVTAGNGYFVVNPNVTATLPATSTIGQTISFVVAAGSTPFNISTNGGTVHVGSQAASSSLTNTTAGDTLTLVCISTGQWYAPGPPQGVWLVV